VRPLEITARPASAAGRTQIPLPWPVKKKNALKLTNICVEGPIWRIWKTPRPEILNGDQLVFIPPLVFPLFFPSLVSAPPKPAQAVHPPKEWEGPRFDQGKLAKVPSPELRRSPFQQENGGPVWGAGRPGTVNYLSIHLHHRPEVIRGSPTPPPTPGTPPPKKSGQTRCVPMAGACADAAAIKPGEHAPSGPRYASIKSAAFDLGCPVGEVEPLQHQRDDPQ